ncbi:hypothetical protein ACSBR2_032921 [Camellia fascicularis]
MCVSECDISAKHFIEQKAYKYQWVQHTEIEVSLNSFRSEKQYQHRILWKMLMKRVVSSFIPSLGFSSLSASMVKSGDVLKQARIFSSSDVFEYSKLSHDLNPLHFDIESAQNAGFEDRLVHGMLIASLFPRIIASHFPGAVYVSQSLQFRSPVYIGEEVIGEVQATNIREIKNKYIAKFKTKCFKHGDHLVVEGEATAILPTLAMEQGQSTG